MRNTFSVEMVEMPVEELFVVGVDRDLVTEKDASACLQEFDDAEEFSLSCSVSCVRVCKLLAVERDWLSILGDHCSEMAMRGIRVDHERVGVVAVGIAWHRFSNDVRNDVLLCRGESCVVLWIPFPCCRVKHEGKERL